MRNYKVPFEYTTFFVFCLLLRTNGPKSITIDKAFEVRKILLDDFYDLGLQNEFLNRKKTMSKFISEYSAYVYVKDNSIYLKEDIDYKDLNILLRDIGSDVTLDYSLSLFKYLEILEPINFIEQLNSLEQKIENLYYKGDYNNIRKYLKIRFEIYNNFSIENDDIIEIVSDLQAEDRMSKEKDYYIYPINKTHYENSLFSDVQYRIEDQLNTPIQKAIFSDCELYSSKIRFDMDTKIDDMEELYTNSESDIFESEENYEYDDYSDSESFDSTVDYEQENNYEYDDDSKELVAQALFQNISYDNLSRKDIIIALKYIDVINDFEIAYGKVDKLDKISQRLKYIIDNEEMNITKKDNKGIKRVLENYLNCDSQDFNDFEAEAGYLLDELIVDHSDSLFLEKLLFVKTYYNLTYDNELFESFNKYKSNRKYMIIHNFIISDNPNVVVDNGKNDEEFVAKMLILK